jgi:polyphosphate kinase 2 (PPK2 family)
MKSHFPDGCTIQAVTTHGEISMFNRNMYMCITVTDIHSGKSNGKGCEPVEDMENFMSINPHKTEMILQEEHYVRNCLVKYIT